MAKKRGSKKSDKSMDKEDMSMMFGKKRGKKRSGKKR